MLPCSKTARRDCLERRANCGDLGPYGAVGSSVAKLISGLSFKRYLPCSIHSTAKPSVVVSTNCPGSIRLLSLSCTAWKYVQISIVWQVPSCACALKLPMHCKSECDLSSLISAL